MRKLNVWLHNNLFTEDPKDYYGKIKSAGTVTNNQLAALMTKEGIELKELQQ